MDRKYGFVMMIKNEWWNEFKRRNDEGKRRHSYVKVGLAPPKRTSKIIFYVAKPVGQAAGYADFIERKTGDAELLWNEFGSESALKSEKQFEAFIKDAPKASFIRFENLHFAKEPMSLNNLLIFLGVRRLSRRGFYLNRDIAEKLIGILE